MGLRTVEEYIDSLRDGRRVIYRGERVGDVTSHPQLARTVRHAAELFRLPEEGPAATWSYEDADLAETVSTFFLIPRTPEELRFRGDIVEESTRRSGSTLNIIKPVGTDAILGLTVATAYLDRAEGTHYGERVAAFRAHCARGDLAMALAATDSKGDRRLRPSQQHDPDLHLRVVSRGDDGIVVRGAKLHTTASVSANELICIPCRAMGPEDAEFAVAFAIPMDAPGLTLICHPLAEGPEDESPVSSEHVEVETLTIFDDVFVPWERVFLCGEWQYAGAIAAAFANFHRYTAISYKPPFADLMVGAAQLAADAVGVAGAGHVREKIAELVVYAELIRAARFAAAQGRRDPLTGILMPEPVATNAGKFHFASNFHAAVRALQDIAGGLVVTAPGIEDIDDPEIGPTVRKYLAGRDGSDGRERWRLMQLVRDLTASEFGGYNLVVSLHGEGSMQAQLVQTLRDYDMDRAVGLVRQVLAEDALAPTGPASP